MVHISTVLQHYKREDIRKEIVESAKDREVAVRYGDKGFGKRPDVLNYPNDVLEFVKQGATSFHTSEERWDNPLSLNPNLKREEINDLRVGWDLVLDIDCPQWEFAKLTAHLMVKVLREHGIKSISCKFSGNKGFHIGVPFECFDVDEDMKRSFPDTPRYIAKYIVDCISEEHIQVKENNTIVFEERYEYKIDELAKIMEKDIKDLTIKRCKRCKKNIEEDKVEIPEIEYVCTKCEKRIVTKENSDVMLCPKCNIIMGNMGDISTTKKTICACGSNDKPETKFNPLSIVEVDTILISSRHLFRMPYSLHEKSGLASVPIDPDKVIDFEKNVARPPVEISEFKFMERNNVQKGEGSRLLGAALESSRNDEEEEKMRENQKKEFQIPEEAIPEKFFPPCILKALKGMKDGKKRMLFTLTNFLSCTGYDLEAIEKILTEWNKKNSEPLRENYIVGHIRYNKQRKKKILPPNCSNLMYYKDLGICCPDNLCNKIKNPVNYAMRKTRYLKK
jgi:DNA primase catalytic subunit